MREETIAPAASRRPPTSRDYGDDGLFQRVLRRLRDFAVMGVVGPATGALAIVAIHLATSLPPLGSRPVAESIQKREAERVMAILEDRAAPAAVRATPELDTPLRETPPEPAPEPAPAPAPEPPAPTSADFGAVTPTPDTRRMADWVVARRDNGQLPFIVLDKRDARLYVFEPDGRLQGQTPVLLGSAHGDETYPGIGDVPIAQVRPYQRTTAAGRFVTQPGLDADHADVVWLDYDGALAMHRVINKVKSEHRLQRIASSDPRVRRISWGCINIPIAFFDRFISPVFGQRSGVTYVIPERKTFAQVFESDPARSAPVLAKAAPEALAPRDLAQR